MSKAVYRHRRHCRVCDGMLEEVLHLGSQYLPRFVENSQKKTAKELVELPMAPLTLCRCMRCGLLQLGDVIEPDLLYKEFWYRSGVNATMRRALQDVVKEGLKWHKSGLWVDIGANDGTLLDELPSEFTRIAVEPGQNFADDLARVADIAIMDYFKADESFNNAQVITSIAMFYDLDEPDQFVADVAKTLAKDGVWINQLNDSPTMLDQNAFDGICHEHQVYYDIPNLARLYARHGLEILNISTNDVNGGSVRVTAGHIGSYKPMELFGLSTPREDEVRSFASRVLRWKARMLEVLDVIPRPLFGYGASTKGGTLLQYLDKFVLDGIADRNPAKWGLCQAGVWAPIMSEDSVRSLEPKSLFVLPWAFRKEFIAREAQARDRGTVMVFPLPNIELVL